MKKAYGYVRLSPDDVNKNKYLAKLQEAGATKGQIYIETISDRNSEYPAFEQLLSLLTPGDLLFVVSLNHLGKNCNETAEKWRIITKERCCDLAVLDTPLIDTRRGEEIKDIVLQMFYCVNSISKSYFRQRQAEGIKKAKERNVSFGRQPKPQPEDFERVKAMYDQKIISGRGAARLLNVSPSTFNRWYQAEKNANAMQSQQQSEHQLS